jgi:predicted nucleotidyltransferase
MARIGPVAGLLGESEARLLHTLLTRAEPLSGRRAADLSGVPNSTAQRLLARLAQSGLVIANASTHAITYELNRDHVMYEAVLKLFQAPSQIQERLERIVERWAGNAVTAAIFGSVARDEAAPDSDVDILIVTPDEFDTAAQEGLMDEIFHDLERASGRPVQIYDVTRSGFAQMVRRNDPLIKNLEADAETVIGTDVAALIGAAR